MKGAKGGSEGGAKGNEGSKGGKGNCILAVLKFSYFFLLFPTFWSLSYFLGGLSLHLNHLIASRMGICYRQFGTLPIGIFLSNLDSRQLDTSLVTSYGHF